MEIIRGWKKLNAAALSVCVFNEDIGLKLEMRHRLLVYSLLHERQKKLLCEPEKKNFSCLWWDEKHILEL